MTRVVNTLCVGKDCVVFSLYKFPLTETIDPLPDTSCNGHGDFDKTVRNTDEKGKNSRETSTEGQVQLLLWLGR